MYADPVNVVAGKLPKDYHCKCKYCKQYIGELRPADGSYYSRLERRKYYSPIEKGEGGHIAKTPLHIARWAIQKFTKPGDWVIDPTIGAGTTAVEAITQGRSVAGMEIEFGHIVEENVKVALALVAMDKPRVKFARGDAREIATFLTATDDKIGTSATKKRKQKFQLMINNPPYWGDISMPSPKGNLRGKEHRDKETRFDYDKTLPNLAFLKEGDEYWEELTKIYGECIDRLVPGGHVVIGVKDQMRNWQSDLLHKKFCDFLDGTNSFGLEFVGTALLKHYPTTLAMNTYANKKGNTDHVPPAWYQTISVFRKG